MSLQAFSLYLSVGPCFHPLPLLFIHTHIQYIQRYLYFLAHIPISIPFFLKSPKPCTLMLFLSFDFRSIPYILWMCVCVCFAHSLCSNIIEYKQNPSSNDKQNLILNGKSCLHCMMLYTFRFGIFLFSLDMYNPYPIT